MIYLLFGIALFFLVLRALRAFAEADPAALALIIRRGGGSAALLAAVFLVLRGRIDMAIGLGGLGVLVARDAQRIVFADVQIGARSRKTESFLCEIGHDRDGA